MRVFYTDDFYLQAAISSCTAHFSNPYAKLFILKFLHRHRFLSQVKSRVS